MISFFSEMEEEDSCPIISGDVENIIIKLEPSENFIDDEDSSTEDCVASQFNEFEGTEETVFHENYSDNEISVEPDPNSSNIVQIPFYLENYFADDDDDYDDNTNTNYHIDTNHLACSCCKIIFPSEKMLHEHLIVHIDINRMGCNVCDKVRIVFHYFIFIFIIYFIIYILQLYIFFYVLLFYFIFFLSFLVLVVFTI